MSSVSPIMIPPAGVAGGELAGADGVRSTSAMVFAIGGSFAFGFRIRLRRSPAGSDGLKCKLGFFRRAGAGPAANYRAMREAEAEPRSASILGGSMGAGIAGVGLRSRQRSAKQGSLRNGRGRRRASHVQSHA